MLNEEANIRRCLESVRWADEIIVVDAGSTDATRDICAEHGCRVIERAWEGYARQKNYAIGLATKDWVLSVDADEEITSELAKEIRTALDSNGPAEAYDMPRSNLFLGRWMRHGGWYPDRQRRLFRRGSGAFKEVPLHEHFVLSDPSARIGRLANPMKHYTYPTVSDFIARADRYTTIEAEARISEGRIPKALGLRLVTCMPIKFAETFIYKGGWLDGVHGFLASVLTSVRVFMRYAKLWERQR